MLTGTQTTCNEGYLKFGSVTTGGGLVFSVDTSSSSGELRSLSINVKARYGAGVGTLRYGLRFRKQVTSSESL